MLWAAMWVGCAIGGGELVAAGAVAGLPAAHTEVRLDDGVWLEVRYGASGKKSRVMFDGRYLEVDSAGRIRQLAPRSLYDRGVGAVTPQGMARVRAALDGVGFFALPSRLAVTPILPDVRLPDGSLPVPQEISITVVGEHGGHRVMLLADVRDPDAMGEIAPLYSAIDREVLGGWMNR